MKRMRLFFSVLMVGALVLTALSVVSAAFGMDFTDGEWEVDPRSEIPKPIVQSGDYGYQINEDGTITIAQYNGSDTDIVIPEEIDGYTVTAIGYQAFTYLEMDSLTIPDTVEVICPRAFEYCDITTDFVLPESVTIQDNAFAYAYLPEVVMIPAGAVLEGDSFAYNKNVELLCIGSGAIIGDSAFGYSYQLRGAVCAEGSCLLDDAFEYSDYLETVVLCGDVAVDGDPVSHCDMARTVQATADEFDTVIEALKGLNGSGQQDESSDGLIVHGWFNH